MAAAWGVLALLAQMAGLVRLRFPSLTEALAQGSFVNLVFIQNSEAAHTLVALAFVLPSLYFALLEGSSRQATWGKQYLGLMVCDYQARPLGVVRGFYRFITRGFPGTPILLVSWIPLLLDPRTSGSSFSPPVGFAILGTLFGLCLIVRAHLIYFTTRKRQTQHDLYARSVVVVR